MAGWVEKRGENKWRLNVQGGTDAEGKRKVYRKTIEASSRREAEKKLAEFVAEVQKRQYIEPSKLTFAEFVGHWLKNYADENLAPKTLHRYKEMLETRILPAMGHLKLEEIKPLHLLEFYQNLQEDGIRADGKPGGLSARTILHHHRLIAAILQAAVDWEVIPSNPARKVKPPQVEKKEVNCYDADQVAAMLAALDKEPIKYKVIVVLALATGCRKGEIMGLEWRDVDFENNTIEIRRASQYLPEKGAFTKKPKNETSSRKIAVPASVMDLLKQHKAQQAEQRLKVGDLWRGSNRLFTTWDGRPMFPDTISNWFPKFLKRHNLPPLTFHGLRHTSATLLLAEGVPLKNVSKRLGHSSVTTTGDIYAHALRSVDREAAEKLDDLLTGVKNKKQA
ncbi:putative prophage phiRv2 integrase [Moorella thermoacetica]|uniref:Prophage phiRv2 integrase n=1 Tax=Neomoorella thermoacetica TaxID=1525 RepID=A0AAC9HH90_NEOTH|nr:site-specific integrase [Moorella thermoacetica]AOQ23856.1 Putative prophage phiRv2 integrase [Moorella thermoacetica]TYL14260.1 putative prophage phiRv2 integrase [Moorella thermoacetica]